jgi:hypothetical protein
MAAKIQVWEFEYLHALINSIANAVELAKIDLYLERLLEVYDLINFDPGCDLPIWRARKCASSAGFEKIRELWCPPRHRVTAGRLNDPGEPMLYVSINGRTALAEIGAQEGDYVQVIGYKINDEKKLRCGIIGEFAHVHDTGRALSLGSVAAQLKGILQKFPPDKLRSFVTLDRFLSAMLRDRTAARRAYVHSRSLGRGLFRRQQDLQAIYYTSVVSWKGAMNLAIKPEVASELLTPVWTGVLRMNERYDDFRIVRSARSSKTQKPTGRVAA